MFHSFPVAVRTPRAGQAAVALATALWLSTILLARADIVTFDSAFANGTIIPDGNPSGWSDTRTVSVPFSSIRDLNVTLNITGGSSGDFYAYLVHNDGSGTLTSILLNRVGVTAGNSFGYADGTLRLTLDDSAANGDVHLYQTRPSYPEITSGGSFQPDGRNTDPATVTDGSTRDSMLSLFNGSNPNGSWTLFVADMVDDAGVTSGGTVISWGMEISSVPEPSQWAMMGVTLVGAGVFYLRHRRAKAGPAKS